MKKRLLSWLLVLTMVISLIPSTLVTTALAAELPTNAPELTFNGDSAEITTNSAYTLTGDLTGKTVTVKNTAVVTLVLDGVTMSGATSPLRLAEGASVTLIVKDGTTNTIACTATAADTTNNGMTAGIHVPDGATLTIDTPKNSQGTGKLTVNGGYGGAGIGGGAAVGQSTTKNATVAANGTKAQDAVGYINNQPIGRTYGGQGGYGGESGLNGANAESAGTVNIKNGVLSVTGGTGGAGIGGGMGAAGSIGKSGKEGGKGENGFSVNRYINDAYTIQGIGGAGGGGGGQGGIGGVGGTGGAGAALNIENGSLTITAGEGAAAIGGGAGGVGGNGATGGNGGIGGNNVTISYGSAWLNPGTGGGGQGGQGGTGGSGGTGGAGGSVNITGGTISLSSADSTAIGGGRGGVGGAGGQGGNGGQGHGPHDGETYETRYSGKAGAAGKGGAGGSGGVGASLSISGGVITASSAAAANDIGGGVAGTNGAEGTAGQAGAAVGTQPVSAGQDGWTLWCWSATEGGAAGASNPAYNQTNGAGNAVTINGTNDSHIWTNIKNTAGEISINARPKDPQGNDLYLYTLTVTQLDGTAVVPNAEVKVTVSPTGGTQYDYIERSNADGKVQLWLPKGEYKLEGGAVSHPEHGNIPLDQALSLSVRDDTGSGKVKIGSPYTEVVVKGMGKPQGGADYTESLYSYTTFIKASTEKQKLDAIGQSGWKLKNVTVESGGTDFVDENNVPLYDKDLANHNVKVLLKSGGKVEVTFLYDYNRAPVTIHSYYEGINGQKVYDSFTIEAEIGKDFTFSQPTLDGYDTVRSDPATPTITVTGTDDHIDFYYTKSEGNVTYKAVDADTNEVLKQKTEKLTSGKTVDVTQDKANTTFGTIPYYTLKAGSGAAVDAEGNAVTTYDGRSDVTVTFTYTRNKHNVNVIRWDSDTNTKIDEVTLDNGGAGFPAGKPTTLTPSAPAGYTQIGGDPSYFVTDDANQTVTVYYRHTNSAEVTVKLLDENDVQFNSYTITGTVGVEMKIVPGAYTGYEFNGTADEKANGVKVTPTEDGPNVVTLNYKPKTYNVTVELKDAAGSDISTSVATFKTTIPVREGEGLTVVAPNIPGYSLKSEKPVVSLTASEIQTDTTKRTVIFIYDTVDKANFVTHTVNFVLELSDGKTETLYTHEKLIPKGTGSQVVYKEDDVKYTVPGYAYQGISYVVGGNPANATDVKDDGDAIITYKFSEATAWIKINQKCTGSTTTTANPDHDATQTLTGYREGQENVVIIAPVLKDHALKSDQPMSFTFDKLKVGENEHTFQYELAGNVTFTLMEKGTNGTADRIIAVLNGVSGKTYNAKDTTGSSPLDLTALGYTYIEDANASVEFKPGGSGTVTDVTISGKHIVYYEKMTRAVNFVAVDKTKLDADGKTLDQVKNDPTMLATYRIGNPVALDPARVGESYKAAAKSFSGYTLADQPDQVLGKVPTGTDALNFYFLYTKKAEGGVEVIFQSADGIPILSYTVSAAVDESFTAKAPAKLEDGKYVLAAGSDESKSVTITNGTQPQRIVFNYTNNFVKVTTKTQIGDAQPTAYETHEVIKASTSPVVPAGSLTLTPPYKTGYELVGIEGVNGATKDTLPTGFNGSVTLTNLTADTTVVYHYKPVEQTIGKYQATVTVTDKYNGRYDIGTWKQVVTKNVPSTITPKSYADYILTGYQVEGDASVTSVNEADAPTFKLTHTFTGNTAVTFIYASADGSITVPGEDDKIGGEDDVVVKPNGPNKPEYVQDDKPVKGSVKVPDGGTVMTPDGPIIPPDGSIVKPNGTIVVPDGNDRFDTIYPKPPVPTPGYVTVTYKANNGTQEKDALRIGKGSVAIQNDTTGLGFTTPANKTFSKWTTDENGHNAMTQTHVTEDTTLYAQWTGSTYAQSITITFNSNTGETRLQTIGVYSSSTISGTLDPNPFRVDGWNFGGWNTDAAGNGVGYTDRQSVSFPQGTADPTLYAQWYRVNVDGSITVPGKDGNPNTPDDNATANGNGTESPKRKDTGEIEIPKGGSVTTGSGETIPLPDGGILKPDGTVIINRPEGGTITVPGTDGTNPDVTNPDGSPDAGKTVVEILYKSNNPQNKEIKSYAVVGDTIKLLPSTSFVYEGHQFLNWREDANNAYYTAKAEIQVTTAMTLEAQWAKLNPDGSVELPGQDGKLPAPKEKDNVTVTPDKPGTIKPQPDGSVKVDGGPGTVERPKDPANPDQGKEEIKVPDGTIVKPDGTIELPKNPDGTGGGTINPGDKLPDNVPAGYHTVTYTDGANNSYQLVEDGKNATALGSSTFSPPAGKYFHKWKENTSGNEFGAGDEISAAIVKTNPTFTAQWSGLGGDLLTITPGYTSAKQGATIRLQAMINGSAVAADKVTWNVAKLGSAASAGTVNSSGDLTVPANAADRDVFVVTAENNGQTANAYIAVNAPIGGTGGSGGGEGSGSSTRIYTITATAGAHGSIDPEGKVSVKGGSDKVFTISPNNGYRIEEVRVDGRSVGTVSYYIFSNVDENHTISVTFAEARPANNNGIADPTETGVAGWLQTREHIAYLGGYGNGLFGPDDNMTRAQAAQMFYNLLLNKNVDITVDFTDVPADEWYGNAVRTLASLGVIKGIGDGQFAPNRTITRAEFTVIAMRFANVSADVTNPFTDIAMNDWYYTAVTSAVSYGWITGYSDGTFKPMATITRAEVATIVNRMLARTADRNFVDSSAVTRFDDVPATYWAYYNIAEATTAHTHTIDNNGVESWGKQK